MDESIYKKMVELKTNRDSYDVSFLGTLDLAVTDYSTNQKFNITVDIMVSIENGSEGPIFRFYDENNNFIAINKNDGQGLLPTSKFSDILTSKENMDSLQKLEEFSYDPESSLNKTDFDIEQVARALGIPKEKVIAMSSTLPYQKDEKDDDKIHLKDENENETSIPKKKQTSKENKKLSALEKQETSLSQKVDDVHTLGEILGVPDNGKLVAVYSDSIENSKSKNNTKFSFLIKDKEGNYTELQNLEQVGGITPSVQVAQSNSDGSKVEQEQVNSFYRIKTSNNIEYMLSARIGSYGNIELGIGQRDRTQGVNGQELVTVTTPLKTSSNYYTTAETRESLNSTHNGTRKVQDRIAEGEVHDDCNAGKDEYDGDPNTGHTHDDSDNLSFSEQQFYEMALDILNESDTIAEVYNRNDVVNALKKSHQSQPNLTQKELSEQVKTSMEENAELEHGSFPSRYPDL